MQSVGLRQGVRHLRRHLGGSGLAGEGLDGARAPEVGQVAPLRIAERRGPDHAKVIAKGILAVRPAGAVAEDRAHELGAERCQVGVEHRLGAPRERGQRRATRLGAVNLKPGPNGIAAPLLGAELPGIDGRQLRIPRHRQQGGERPMCTRVWAESERLEIEAQGDLASYLGVPLDALVIDSRYLPQARGAKVCLCPVEVTKMLDAAGKVWRFDGGDPMEIIVQ